MLVNTIKKKTDILPDTPWQYEIRGITKNISAKLLLPSEWRRMMNDNVEKTSCTRIHTKWNVSTLHAKFVFRSRTRSWAWQQLATPFSSVHKTLFSFNLLYYFTTIISCLFMSSGLLPIINCCYCYHSDRYLILTNAQTGDFPLDEGNRFATGETSFAFTNSAGNLENGGRGEASLSLSLFLCHSTSISNIRFSVPLPLYRRWREQHRVRTRVAMSTQLLIIGEEISCFVEKRVKRLFVLVVELSS